MTIDLRDKTVEELFIGAGNDGDWESVAIELARHLAEAEQKSSERDEKIKYYEDALCFPMARPDWIEPGIPAMEISPIKVGKLLGELDSLRQKLAEQDVMLATIAHELTSIVNDIPASSQGEFIIEHFDIDGEHVGSESVDPIIVVGRLVGGIEQLRESLPASAKANAEILKAAREHEFTESNRPEHYRYNDPCKCVVCLAVRAAKETL